MAADKVLLVFVGGDVQLIRLPSAGGYGPLVACGRGWQQEMSRARAEAVVSSRPDMFEIVEISQEAII